jgi:sugar O-acyltransferase (sialic acid O-acetyltransferase NeuD family)
MSTELASAIHVLGGGGHGKVVVDALLCGGWPVNSIHVHDDTPRTGGLLGCTMRSPLRLPAQPAAKVHAAIGNAGIRQQLLAAWPEADWLLIRHPRAVCAASGTIGFGTFVAALSIIGPEAQVGRGVIVNHGAVVDHDAQVGDFSHIGPLASLGGGARVGRQVLVGAGARILPGVRIGDGATVGAGAVVLNDIEPGGRVAGVPARYLNGRT